MRYPVKAKHSQSAIENFCNLLHSKYNTVVLKRESECKSIVYADGKKLAAFFDNEDISIDPQQLNELLQAGIKPQKPDFSIAFALLLPYILISTLGILTVDSEFTSAMLFFATFEVVAFWAYYLSCAKVTRFNKPLRILCIALMVCSIPFSFMIYPLYTKFSELYIFRLSTKQPI